LCDPKIVPAGMLVELTDGLLADVMARLLACATLDICFLAQTISHMTGA